MSRQILTGAVSALVANAFVSATYADDAQSRSSLESIVVTGSPLSQDPDAQATIVDSVSQDQILRSGGANLADALSNVPGVTTTSFASGASRPVIRGFDANRVRVLEDGVGSFDVSDIGPDHGVPIDPLSAQKIEVVRGAATLRYGSQAIGGVVNAINNRVPTQLPDAPFSADVNGTYATNSDTVQGAAMMDGRIGQFAVHADGFDRHADDYDTPRGMQENSFFRGDGYSAGSSYFFDGGSRIGADVVHYDAKYGIPSDTTYIDMRQTKEMLRSSFALDAGALKTLNVEGGYAEYQHEEREPDGGVDSTFKDREWDARAEALLGEIGPFSGAAFGVQSQRRNFQALGDDADYLLPTLTSTGAIFAFGESPLSNGITLQTGVRVEHVGIDGTPASDVHVSRDFTPVSASAGLAFVLSQTVRLGLTASSAARAPAQTELFARGPHDGPGTFETGDPALDMERANSLEASIRYRAGDVRVEGSLWGAKFNNYIYGELTGLTCDEAGVCGPGDFGEFRQLNYTQLGAKFYGAESKATIGLGETGGVKFAANLLADYVRATLDNGTNVPREPPYHVGAGLSWDAARFDGDVFVKYAGAQNETAPSETPTAGFVSVDAQLGWRPLKASPGVELALVGHNLTDSVQRNAIALNKDEVILPGRDVRLTVRAKF